MTAELFRALGILAEPPARESRRVTRLLGLPGDATPEAYTDLFLFQLYPYASVYLGKEGMLGGEGRDRVAGFWRAAGERVPAEPDHLALLLGAYARLIELEDAENAPERRAARRRQRVALVWEHLVSWLGVYLAKVDEIARPPYDAWARLLRRALGEEVVRLGRPDALPLALRETAPADAALEHDLLAALLAPVRSGVVLTRHDLVRAAHELGLGLRQGERRFVLQALVDQDAPRAVAWLADEAERWTERHLADRSWLGDIATDWSRRAAATAQRLRSSLTIRSAP